MTHNPVQGAVNVSTGLFVFIPLVSNSHGSLPNTTSVVPFVSLSFSPYASRAFPLYSCCNLSLSLSLSLHLCVAFPLFSSLSIVCLPLSVYNLCMSVSVCVCVSLSFTLSHNNVISPLSLCVCVSPSKLRPCWLI